MELFNARKRVGLTQAEVSKRLGITVAAVSLWESGKSKPRIELLPKIAKLYGMTVDELLSDNPGDT